MSDVVKKNVLSLVLMVSTLLVGAILLQTACGPTQSEKVITEPESPIVSVYRAVLENHDKLREIEKKLDLLLQREGIR